MPRGGPRPGTGAKKGSRWSQEAKDRARAAREARKKAAEDILSGALEESPAGAPAPASQKMNELRMAQTIIAAAARLAEKRRGAAVNPFQLPSFPPAAIPTDKKLRMAMDSGVGWANAQWAGASGAALNALGYDGLAFLGYPFLSELAQRPEYRVISETIADDATRKWIDFEITGEREREEKEREEKDRQSFDPGLFGKEKPDAGGAARPVGRSFTDSDPQKREDKLKASGKADKVKRIKDEIARIGLRDALYAISRDDGFFGRSHLLMKFGDQEDEEVGAGDGEEWKSDIGDGRDDTSKTKVNKDKPLTGVTTVEAVWCYPTTYNANAPWRKDFYRPQVWYILGKQIHVSRLLPFVGHQVPDLLKPSYSFGGVSLSQLAMPYVNIWLQTRNAVGALIHSFSVMVLKTDLQTSLQPGGAGVDGLMARAAAFNLFRDNSGLFLVNNSTEDFTNVSASLSGLHELQAQSQEHMASVARIPLVKLTGISPTGLNACLTGDTLIETDRGQVPIRDARPGQKVMTREGWAPIAKAGRTGYAAELIEIQTAESTIRCTADHRIWLPSINAFVPAENVRRGDLLLRRGATENQNTADQLSIEAGFGGTQGTTITPPRRPMTGNVCFTGRFGGFIRDLFRRAITSITSTEIEQTISSTISKYSRPQITRSFTALTSGSLFQDQPNASASVAIAASGSSRQRARGSNFAAIGAGSPIDEGAGRREPSRAQYAFALPAEHPSRPSERTQSFALGNVQPQAKTALPICPNTTKNTLRSGWSKENVEVWSVVSDVRRVPAQEFVYDIQVASGCLPEFFANGVLVHNSSEGEMMAYYDTIAAYQNRFLRPNLTKVVNFVQLSLFGEVDPEITFEFEPLRDMNEKERAELKKVEQETIQIQVDGGAISQEEWRGQIIDDPDQPFADLDPDDVPELKEEEQQGLVPPDAGKGLEAILGDPSQGGGQAPGGAAPPAPAPAPAPAAPAQDPAFQPLAKPAGGAAAEDRKIVPFAGDLDPLFHGVRDFAGAQDAFEWLEDDHPRDPKGEFSSKGGGGTKIGAPTPLDPSKLKRVGPQMGSNPGGVFEDAKGRKFYVKEGRSKDHVRNELTAAALYDLAVAPTLRYRPVAGGGHVATEMEKLSKKNASELSPAEIAKAKRDFLAHAWTANYDAVGTGGDNLVAARGEPFSVDLGGALEYRAQGKPKGASFGDEVTEIDNMRGKNPDVDAPDAAAIFGDITPAEFKESAAKVTRITDGEIKRAIEDLGGSDALVAKMIARRDDIAARARTFGAEGKPDKATSTVIFPAGDALPVKALNGVKFEKWDPPKDGDWNEVDGQMDLDEDALPERVKGRQLASGAVVREKDGRTWLMQPKNMFGGYSSTFPKGRVEPGLSMQANAIKEAFEETGLKVRITGVAGDREGDVTFTRYYTAEREGGDPANPPGGETDGVVLAPPSKLAGFLNRDRDRHLAKEVVGDAAFEEGKHPRRRDGEFSGPGAHSTAEAYARLARAEAGARELNERRHAGGGRGGLKPIGAALGYGERETGYGGDAEPRTLYANRPLTNAADLVGWARRSGFAKTLRPEDMHVTVAFSKTPLAWPEPEADPVRIHEGGDPRSVERLGDEGAVVLRFGSSDLEDRCRALRDAGASWDHESYKPHVTFTMDAGDVDLSSIEPYGGPLEFGPEEFDEIGGRGEDWDWADRVRDSLIGDAGWEESKHPRGNSKNAGQFGSGGGAKPTQGGAGAQQQQKPQGGGNRAVMRAPGTTQRADKSKMFEKSLGEILDKATPEQRENYKDRVKKCRQFFASDDGRAATAKAVKGFVIKHAAGMAQYHLTDAIMLPVVHSVVERAVDAVGLGMVPGLTLGATAVAAYATNHLMDHFHLTIGGAKDLLISGVRNAIDVLGGAAEVAARVGKMEDADHLAGDEDKDDDLLDAMILLLLALEEVGDEPQARDEAPWNESQHPRDKSGKFAESAGGGENSPEAKKIKETAKKAQPLGVVNGPEEDQTEVQLFANGEDDGKVNLVLFDKGSGNPVGPVYIVKKDEAGHVAEQMLHGPKGNGEKESSPNGANEAGFRAAITKINDAAGLTGAETDGTISTAEQKMAAAAGNGMDPDDGIVIGAFTDNEMELLDEKHGGFGAAYQAALAEKKDDPEIKTSLYAVKSNDDFVKEFERAVTDEKHADAAHLAIANEEFAEQYRQDHPEAWAAAVKFMPSAPKVDAWKAEAGAELLSEAETKIVAGLEQDLGKAQIEESLTEEQKEALASAHGGVQTAIADVESDVNKADAKKKTKFGGLWKETGGGVVADYNKNAAIVLGKPATAGQSYRQMLTFLINQNEKLGIGGADLPKLKTKLVEALLKAQDKAIGLGKPGDATKLQGVVNKIQKTDPGIVSAAVDAHNGPPAKPWAGAAVFKAENLGEFGAKVKELVEGNALNTAAKVFQANAELAKTFADGNPDFMKKLHGQLNDEDKADVAAVIGQTAATGGAGKPEKNVEGFQAAVKAMWKKAGYGEGGKGDSVTALHKVKLAAQHGASASDLIDQLTMAENISLKDHYGSVAKALAHQTQEQGGGPGSKNLTAAELLAELETPPKPGVAGKAALENISPEGLAKAKKSTPIPNQYEAPEAQKLVDQFNEKYAGKTLTAEAALKQKVADHADLMASVGEANAAWEKATAGQKKKAAEEQAKKTEEQQQKAAAAAKKAAEETKAKNAKVMRELGITEQEADGFNALVGMLGGKSADVMQTFKNYEKKAKSYGYPITGFQTALISNYTDGGYGPINNALRGGSWTAAQHVYVKMVNKALQGMPSFKGVTYRGAGLDSDVQALYKVGNVVEERAFTSSSPSGGSGGNTKYVITAIGKHGASVKKLSNYAHEDEVLFGARTFFKVTKIEGKPGGHMTVHMEEMED